MVTDDDNESYALPDVPSSDDENEEGVHVAHGAGHAHEVAPPVVAEVAASAHGFASWSCSGSC